MANKKFQVPINLLNLASNPASASEGDIYYNTLDDTIRLYANGSWVNVGAAGPSGVINVTSPITNSGTSTSAQLGFDQTAQNTTNDARYARLSGATFTGDILGGSTFSAFTTTNNLTLGKIEYLQTNGTFTNNILSGGSIQSLYNDLEVIDNYSVRNPYAANGNATQTINIGTGNTTYAGESESFLNINIGTGTGINRNINIGSDGTGVTILGYLTLPPSLNATDINASSLTLSGNLTVNGITTTINSSTLTVDDKNIELGSVSSGTYAGTISSTALVTTVTGTLTNKMVPGMTLTKTSGSGAFGSNATITSIDSLTQFTFTSTSSNTVGSVAFTYGGASNLTADGGGITLKGTTDKTFNWLNATSAWTSSEHISLASGKNLLLNGSTSGTITLTPAATAGTNTITLPAATGTVALLDSPAFTGTPTAPTASANTSTTQIATTAYVVEHSETLVAKLTATTGAIANTQTQVVAFTAPANSIVAGDVFRFTGYANASGGTTASPILRIRIGTTTLTGAIVSELTGTTTTSTTPFKFEAIVTCRTAGSSGTVGGASSVIFATGSSTQSITSAVTVNTTVSNIVEATFQSGGTRTYTFEHAILEKLPS